MPAIDGEPKGKNVLSMQQFTADDIGAFIDEAYAAETVLQNPDDLSTDILHRRVLKAVMRQESTRTAGSMTTAMYKLGGSADLISGMQSSAEAKGESVEDSWVAYVAQSDVIGTRTKEDDGPRLAASVICQAVKDGNLERAVPIINLGDGRNEHPTQALGDLFTIHTIFRKFEGLKLAMVGDHERYRPFHSLIIGAATVGMEIIAVDSVVAPVPEYLMGLAGSRLRRTGDLDAAMREADILYVGRNPDEYSGDDDYERTRTRLLDEAYDGWIVDRARLQQMSTDSIVMHARPRRRELSPDTDADPRTMDIPQMVNMIPARMAILAAVFGKSIRAVV